MLQCNGTLLPQYMQLDGSSDFRTEIPAFAVEPTYDLWCAETNQARCVVVNDGPTSTKGYFRLKRLAAASNALCMRPASMREKSSKVFTSFSSRIPFRFIKSSSERATATPASPGSRASRSSPSQRSQHARWGHWLIVGKPCSSRKQLFLRWFSRWLRGRHADRHVRPSRLLPNRSGL